MAYDLLPFVFKPFGYGNLLLSNDSGDYYFISTEDFDDLISGNLQKSTDTFQDLKSNHFITTDLNSAVDMMAVKLRTRKSFLRNFTSLHMLVVTLRCNQKCNYCQVRSESEEAHKYDMKPQIARAIVDCIFKSPSNTIKIEFQGGEPVLNWDTVAETVGYAQEVNKTQKKNLEFVICTNLTTLDRDRLQFLADNNVNISTSLDGPEDLHNKNRVFRNSSGSYSTFISKLNLAKEIIGKDKISALMTTTSTNINNLIDVIDEYIRLDFPGVFLRPLNPYGFANENQIALGYSAEDFVKNYMEAINYLIEINSKGKYFAEYYTTLLLSRILTPFGTGFVDLQSPSGAGISGAIYDYNGDVYPADEGRMLARMGDRRFLMGNVKDDDFLTIFHGDIIREICKKSCIECIPNCNSCVYKCYCGGDPVRNYLETGDVIHNESNNFFCSKHMGIFQFLFNKIRENDPTTMKVFWSWVNNRPIEGV